MIGSATVRRNIAVACAVVASAATATRAHADDAPLAERAIAILKVHCARCHGGSTVGDSADRGGFDHVLDAERMASDGQLERFSPERSEIVSRIRDGEMPPSGETPRPSAGDLAAIEQWIAAGACAPEPGDESARREAIGVAGVAARVDADLRAQPPRSRGSLRYVSIAHLFDAGRSSEELALARAGLAKLLASLSWSPSATAPQAIDDTATIFRVDLAQLGWSAAMWERAVEADPYAVAGGGAIDRRIRRATRSLVPIVRADWLVSAASRPPLYHEILGLPEHARVLERRLDVAAPGERARAGFNGSGVSRNNRVIERRARPDGEYYWRSYDFDGSAGRRNVFDFPLEFAHDGGEIIFSLPNGMQAYMLVDGAGNRIDRAPTRIVVDPARPDSAVENGISCMSCHSLGMIAKRDQIRAHLVANRGAFDRADFGLVDRALELYAEHSEMDALLSADGRRFEAALDALGARTEVEPISFLARRFEAELTLADVAGELGVSLPRVRRALERTPALRRALGSLLVSGGTVKRDAFALAFSPAVRALDLGIPLSGAARATKLALSCDAAGGRVCYLAGNLYYHGRGVAVDRSRAARLYRAGCTGGVADACNAEAYLHHLGHGVSQDPASAARLYRRACDLGSARGCHVFGLHLLRGDGVARDPSRAVVLLGQACGNGRVGACEVAGDELFSGHRVRRDRGRASELYASGCEGGVAASCRKLGDQHLFGRGATIDWLRANQLYRQGCQLGDRRSCLAAGDLLRAARSR